VLCVVFIARAPLPPPHGRPGTESGVHTAAAAGAATDPDPAFDRR